MSWLTMILTLTGCFFFHTACCGTHCGNHLRGGCYVQINLKSFYGPVVDVVIVVIVIVEVKVWMLV